MGRLKKSSANHLIGRVFGRLTVVSFVGWHFQPNGDRYHKWKCLCSCGKYKDIVGKSLTSKLTKSCGCLKSEKSVIQGKINGLTYNEDSAFNALYCQYMHNARKRKLNFNLSKDEFKIISIQNCYYCNVEPKQIKKAYIRKSGLSNDYIYNGVDRVDSNIGYNIDNCVSCCTMCNIMKLNYTTNDFLNHLKKILKNMNKKI